VLLLLFLMVLFFVLALFVMVGPRWCVIGEK
jgi:hypothetical protein